jgi:hypothetical protein
MSRTSFLTYFQQLSLTQRSNNDTPSAFRPNIHREWSSPYFRSEKIGDEEVQPEHNAHDDTPHLECTRCGNPATKISKKTRPGFYDIWSVVCVVSFTCLLVLFALDLTFGLYGMGTGAAECMVQTSATSSQKNDQVRKTCRCRFSLYTLTIFHRCNSALFLLIVKHLVPRHGVFYRPNLKTSVQPRSSLCWLTKQHSGTCALETESLLIEIGSNWISSSVARSTGKGSTKIRKIILRKRAS